MNSDNNSSVYSKFRLFSSPSFMLLSSPSSSKDKSSSSDDGRLNEWGQGLLSAVDVTSESENVAIKSVPKPTTKKRCFFVLDLVLDGDNRHRGVVGVGN